MAYQQPSAGYPDPARAMLDGRSVDRQSVTARRDVAAWRAFRVQSVPAQRLFGLLRSLPGADQSIAGLSAAMAVGDAEIMVLLEALTDSDLVEITSVSARSGTGPDTGADTAPDARAPHVGAGRYAVTVTGAALRPEWSGAESRSIQRWFDWCLANAAAAADLLYPQALRLEAGTSTTIPVVALPTSAHAATWLDAEIDNLQSAIQNARRLSVGRFAWLLADALRGRAWQDPYRVNWIAAADAAVIAALADGGPRETAAAYLCLADACFLAGEMDRAEEACVALGANAARAGWLSGCAASYANRGGINHRRGRLDRALRDYQHALELSAAAGRPTTQATLYNNIASIKRTMGVHAEAVALHRRALVIFRQVGSLNGEARTLELLAQAWLAAGRLEAAERALLQAFMVYGRLADRVGEARTRSLAARLSQSRPHDPQSADVRESAA